MINLTSTVVLRSQGKSYKTKYCRHVFIQKVFLSTHCVPGTVLHVGNILGNK